MVIDVVTFAPSVGGGGAVGPDPGARGWPLRALTDGEDRDDDAACPADVSVAVDCGVEGEGVVGPDALVPVGTVDEVMVPDSEVEEGTEVAPPAEAISVCGTATVTDVAEDGGRGTVPACAADGVMLTPARRTERIVPGSTGPDELCRTVACTTLPLGPTEMALLVPTGAETAG